MERKCCCVKEPTGYVPIARVIAKVDECAAKNDSAGIERVLAYWEKEARELGDDKGLLEILSEQVGFYRRAADAEKGVAKAREALALLECGGAGDSVSDATVYLNCATTLAAFGNVDEAAPYYARAKEIYEKLLPPDDFRLAGLYNNLATAYMKADDQKGAEENYLKAAQILKKKGGYCELAITYVNLAQLSERFDGAEEAEKRIDNYLQLAYECLDDESIPHDGNYANVCNKCAAAFGYYGYFLRKKELEERAKNIYAANAEN